MQASKYWATERVGMFGGRDQTEHFRSMATILPSRVVRRAPRPSRLARARTQALPPTYVHEQGSCSTAELLGSTETAGLVVLKAGRCVYERYWLGASRSSQWSVWSITKSFVSALVGVAVAEAAIASVLDPVDKYAPELSRGAYAGVPIRDVLQMSSGVAWREDYGDPSADIRKSASELAGGEGRDELATTRAREFPPGRYHRYNSLDTHVLGMVLRRATRTPLTIYLRDKLWHPLGMESDAFWIVDGRGLEWSEGGLNLCLRDLARFGLLYANRGRVADRQVLSPEWIAASSTADAPHLRPGTRATSSSAFGYGYQWWIPDDSGAFCAMGVYNQFLYIDPRTNVIIGKFSAPRGYALDASPDSYREPEHMACFRAICDALA